MSNNLQEDQVKHSGIIKLKNPNLTSSDQIKISSDDFFSGDDLSEAGEKYKTGRWHPEEHFRFIRGCLHYGNNWKKVKECVETRSSAQIRSHAQKYIIKLCKKYNIQDNKHLKNFKNIKKKLPLEIIKEIKLHDEDDCNGNQRIEASNLKMEEIEEIILGIFKTNVNKSASPNNDKMEEKEKINPIINEDRKVKVFETIKEPKNLYRKKLHRIHLHNQTKKANVQNNNMLQFNNLNNSNLMNMNLMNQLGINDPQIQMLLNNNMMTGGMNMNMGSFAPNLLINNNNYGNKISLDQLLTGKNFDLQAQLQPSANKEDLNNKNSIDNYFLNYLLNSNMNGTDFNNDEMLLNLMKANSNMNRNNLMGGISNQNLYSNQNTNQTNFNNLIGNDTAGMDNLNMFNDLLISMLNPNNNRASNPFNDIMIQMYGNNQTSEMSNNKNFANNTTMNSANSNKDSTKFINNKIGLSNNLYPSCTEQFNGENASTPINQNNNLIKAGNPTVKNNAVNLQEENIDNNLGDFSKIQSLQHLASTMKMFGGGNLSGINSTPNELICNFPEILSNNNMGSLFFNTESKIQPVMSNVPDSNAYVNAATINSIDAKKEGESNIRPESSNNVNAINPSKPNENFFSDDMSMLILNLLNYSNPNQLPPNLDLNSFSQLFDIQNINNFNNNHINTGNNNIKKHNDNKAPNIEQINEEKEDSNLNKTHISSNQNINNDLAYKNCNNSNIFSCNNPINNNMMNRNLDFNFNQNLFQQPSFNNIMADPLMGLVNQFFVQPNNMMPNSTSNNLPIFNSISQNDNFYFNNFNPIDLYLDPNLINHNSSNTGNNKKSSEK